MGLTSPDITRLVSDYMDRFHKTYKVPRHGVDQMIEEWCDSNLGRKYRDWTFYRGHVKDPYCAVSIVDPKWCTIFELRFAEHIIGTIDRKQKNKYNTRKENN